MSKFHFDDDCPLCQEIKNNPDPNVKYVNIDLDDPRTWDAFEDPEKNKALFEACDHIDELVKQRRLDEAETACIKMIRDFPKEVEGLLHLGEVFEAKGKLPEAIQTFEQAIAFTHAIEGYDEEPRELCRAKIEGIRKRLP
jgi:tetratricopeptide (TPR) repeat protein